jgi:hypothetical protein
VEYILDVDDVTMKLSGNEIGNISLWIKKHPRGKIEKRVRVSDKDALELKLVILSFETHKHFGDVDKYRDAIGRLRALEEHAESDQLREELLLFIRSHNLYYDWYALELWCLKNIEGFRDYMKESLKYEEVTE